MQIDWELVAGALVVVAFMLSRSLGPEAMRHWRRRREMRRNGCD